MDGPLCKLDHGFPDKHFVRTLAVQITCMFGVHNLADITDKALLLLGGVRHAQVICDSIADVECQRRARNTTCAKKHFIVKNILNLLS